jgi:uncharacterized protein YbjQ (UPF0145 family)
MVNWPVCRHSCAIGRFPGHPFGRPPGSTQDVEGGGAPSGYREVQPALVPAPAEEGHMSDIIVSTMNDLPGYEVVEVYGEVFGLIARARNVFSNIGAGLRTLVGGEARGYTTLLADSRDQAVERMRDAARARGANAVLAMRFDCNELQGVVSEVAAYGTAVRVRPLGAH